jgi:hypothetical protein
VSNLARLSENVSLHSLAFEKAVDQFAVVKIGAFNETHEGPTITL